MTALRRKLGRDLVAQIGQVLTIAAVIGCGIGAYVSMRGTWKSLETSRDLYFQQYRLGDVFVHLDRAPAGLEAQLQAIPDVASVETRLVEPVRLFLGDVDPPRGWLVSLPADGEPNLDAVWIRRGRAFEPGRHDEALLLGAFAEAQGVDLGDAIGVLMNGERREVRIVGIADSPEFIFALTPGEMMHDPSRVAVLWMEEAAIAPVFQMEGSFDDVILRLQPGGEPLAVVAAVDRMLERYGGTGALTREDQPSVAFLDQEMAQLEMLATTIPVVFLGVAGFLLQVVLSRIIQLQRTSIATLKAFGYTRVEIGAHYLGFVSAVGVLGAIVGLALGVWFGTAMTGLYARFFHLPAFAFRLDGELVGTALLVSVAAATVGALGTVQRVVAMAPAEAMQPPSPPVFRRGLLESIGLFGLLGPAARMTVRDLLRHPARLGFSVLGIAAATAIVVLGRFSDDALAYFEDVVFEHVQAEDIAVTFVSEVPERAVRSLEQIPGVRYAEGQRQVRARFTSGHIHRDGPIVAYPPAPKLRRLLDWPLTVVPVPEQGIALTDVLGEILGVGPGDSVDIEMLFGEHARVRLPVVRLVAEPLGLQGHTSLATLARVLQEPVLVNSAFLTVDPEDEAEVVRRLADIPGVLGATRKRAVLERFRQQTGESRYVFTLIASAFGAAMAIGVVYNNARISLSARDRELASLRVLGFTQAEVVGIVVGELFVQVALGIPLGLWLGLQMAIAILSTVDPETWRFPMVIASRTYASAAVLVLVSSAGCAWLVRGWVRKLDLIGVLKTRE